MIIICITIVLVVAFVCATICFIQHEKTYASSDLSESQLLEDVHIRAFNVYDRYLDEYNKAYANESTFYIDGKELYTTLEDIIEMTNDYNNQKD